MLLTRNEQITRSLERLEEVRRVAEASTLSKQPRFKPDSHEAMFTSIYHWIRRADLEEPPYHVDSRKRDTWLSEFWKKESHLAGVVNSVVNIDKNRAFAITGGRNQVNRYTNILRQAEGGEGWRYYINQQAQNYYTTDIGAITELGRDGSNGPLRALYTLDSTLCRLTGHFDKPLRYDKTQRSHGRQGTSSVSCRCRRAGSAITGWVTVRRAACWRWRS